MSPRPNRTARLVLGTAVAVGVLHLAYYLLVRPAALGIDFRVYHVAARTAMAGGDVYAASPTGLSFRYLYPPVTVLAFVPLAVTDSWVPGFVVHTGVTVGTSVLATWLVVGYVEGHGGDLARVDRLLVGGFFLLSSHAAPSLAFGQVNHYLAAALVGTFVALDRGREWLAGGLLGLAATLKVFPAAVGLWFVGRRAWRAVAGAAATVAGLGVLGIAVLGLETTRRYLFAVLPGRLEIDAFAGGLDPGAGYATLRRPLSVLAPGVDPGLYGVAAAALLAPVLALTYLDLSGPLDRLVAIHATVLVALLALPSLLTWYLIVFFSLVGLLYLLPPGRPRQLLVAGGLVSGFSTGFGGLARALAVLPVSEPLREGVLGVARPVFALGTPVLWGSLLMLAACALYSWPPAGPERA